MKNFHLPLPDHTYEALRTEAQRSRVPATSMARQAIQTWLQARKKAGRRKAIEQYAAEMAGSKFDLDAALERATVELLLDSESK
ncbi:MAG TPA: hypothetical protein VN841_00475 [Bryobacteraceae bacterium]|nr:hypothetical protein [Bryobacteraceae bacterium]